MSNHRRACAVDANQTAIVKALRAAGATVAVTSAVGKGFPDIIAGYQGVNYLMEIKDGSKPPSARPLTADQITLHAKWRGLIFVVLSIDEALKIIGAMDDRLNPRRSRSA